MKIEYTGKDKKGQIVVRIIEGASYKNCEMQARRIIPVIQGRKVLREEVEA